MSQAQQLITEHIDIWTSAIVAKSGVGRGSSKKRELYGIKKLRDLILELAVRGKLVPQDPTDEPASVLLERISDEATELVKAKKIKKPKILPQITDDEKPFVLPAGWEWERLPSCYYIVGSKINQIQTKEYLELGSYLVVDQGQKFIAGYCDDKSKVLEIERPVIVFGDHTKNIKFIDFNFVIGADGVKVLCPYSELSTRFLYQVIKSYDLADRGYARHFKVLNEKLAPLPPLAEQHRIVAKVDELMLLCDQLEQQTEASIDAHATLVEVLLSTLTDSADADELAQNWARIAEHFDTLFTTEQSIDALKQTILQLAVMGKLVPQNPDDEPASVLLDKIAAEKAKLVEEKKIKKQKPLSMIEDNEKPYDVPGNWAWCRIGNASISTDYGLSSKTSNDDNGVPVLKMGDIQASKVITGGQGTVSKETEGLPYLYLESRDLLYNRTNSVELVGKTGIFTGNNDDYSFASYLIRIRTLKNSVLPEFININMASPDFRKNQIMPHIKQQCGQANVNGTIMKNMLIALAPESEQHRIVAKVDELFEICDKLKDKLQQSQQTQVHLTDALVDSALA
ncbi:restriction endonuclease subunit S [Oceanisphaera sp. IT1-181]|uniref:restriction endonuclease subunit S n=1 Tax=Oceanisphaera sp. IT1-181 TaxID=3081199 RepID=UPI0029CA0CB2|nr:restriction endonuclease subunit S [Oceanisphaera sp. IT1-181]